MDYPRVTNYVDGVFSESGGNRLDVVSPLDGSIISSVPLSTERELNMAVEAAQRALVGWSAKTLHERSDVLHRYRSLLIEHRNELASLIHVENGKTVGEGCAEVDKAIEVTEFACAVPQLAEGKVLEVGPEVECRIEHAPMGVVASITPFNFPIMVPHWTIPIAMALGNTMILKPSEKVPLGAQRTAELLQAAGLPNGVFNVVHGDKQVVDAICDHPAISAVSFVGSTPAAKAVYRRATDRLKRALAMGGAKNHLVVLPDADPARTAENVVASMAGCAGQRCMAASSMVAVGAVDHVIEAVSAEASRMILGQDLGAVISMESKQRIEAYISEAENAGAKVLVDGRNARVENHEHGFYVGPTVVDRVRPDMRIAREEIFGPVLAIIRADTIEDALAIENASPFGNAAAVYTQNGALARKFIDHVDSGMIGVNIGVPVPREPFGFGGWNDSRFGVGDITGRSSIAFWTQSKKITTRW